MCVQSVTKAWWPHHIELRNHFFPKYWLPVAHFVTPHCQHSIEVEITTKNIICEEIVLHHTIL